MLKESTLANISYHKVTEMKTSAGQGYGHHGEYTHRTIIPIYVPQPKNRNVKAIDVTSLSEADRQKTLTAWNKYQEYLAEQRKELLNFDQFVYVRLEEDLPEAKWRTFKPDQLQETK